MPLAKATEYDTIAAIATPPGEGAISIVRVSGDDAVELVTKLFRGKDLRQVPTIRLITATLLTRRRTKKLMR